MTTIPLEIPCHLRNGAGDMADNVVFFHHCNLLIVVYVAVFNCYNQFFSYDRGPDQLVYMAASDHARFLVLAGSFTSCHV